MSDDKRRELLRPIVALPTTPDAVAEVAISSALRMIAEAGALLVFLDDHADEATVIGALQMMYRKGRADQRAKDIAAVRGCRSEPFTTERLNSDWDAALEAAAQEIENQTE